MRRLVVLVPGMAAVVMFVVFGGCFDPAYRDGLSCSGVTDCPPTQTCVRGACVACMPVELCGEAPTDDDCDGTIDEGCACVDGTRKPCGLQFCEGESVCVSGRWGPCEGERTPEAEICEGVTDEDCDGAIDNGCPCSPVGAIVMSNCGPCSDGDQVCTSTGLGACENGSPHVDCCPTESRNCGTSTGACTVGTEACTPAGRWSGVCSGVASQTEICNGVDDDCDGSTDEVCPPCISIGNILVHDMAPTVAGDSEFAGHGPDVTIDTRYSISAGRVCARVEVKMVETGGGDTVGDKVVTACSPVASGSIAAVVSNNTVHHYVDNDTSAGDVWDYVAPLANSDIGTIRCVGDTGGPDICNGGSLFDCSGCELLSVCPIVRYQP